MYSALEADFSALMRYINSPFTYLLIHKFVINDNGRVLMN